jgi:hypothetical protein
MPVLYTFFIKEDGDLRARFVVDSRRYSSTEEAREVANDASDEVDRRRLIGEREVHDIYPSDPFSKLPEWSEYKLDIDAKHPLPDRRRTGADDEDSTGS